MLNILGLAIGLGCALLIYLFVQHELSYDRFLPASDQIYRVIEHQPNNVFMGSDRFIVTPASLGAELQRTFPEVTDATTLGRAVGLLEYGQDAYYEYGIWADSNFFGVLSFPVIAGDPQTMLQQPDGMILTASLAEKIFGDANPVGATIDLTNWGDLYNMQVVGVVEDPPENSHLQYSYILPIHANAGYQRNLEQRTNNSYMTYLKLQAGASARALQDKMDGFERDYLGEEDAENYNYIIQPIADIHLRSKANFELGTPGDMQRVFLFGTIGVLILLLACVNYMNLAVARSIKRAQEVGVRQAIGARKMQIAGQFIFESVLIAGIALVLSLSLVHFGLPIFSSLVDRTIEVNWLHPLLLPGLGLLVLGVGIISGSYPAFFMSRIQPVQVLKGKGVKGKRRSGLQRTLIVMQYTISIALIAGSLVVYQQLQYIQQKEVGYNRDQMVALRLSGSDIEDRIDTILEEMRRVPGVLTAGAMSHLPTNIESSQRMNTWDGSAEGQQLNVYQSNVDAAFFDLFDIPLVTGRPFSADMASDTTNSVIINETAVWSFGWSMDDVLGKRIRNQYEVVGVMKDFHLHSLHLPIAPLMVRMGDDWYGYVVARVESDAASATVAGLENVLSSFTNYPVSHQYLDDVYRDMYEADTRLGRTIGYFAFIAVLIATLGLFGLAAYATQQRTKEIGVRKVLGATVPNLLALLSREFVLLVLVSIVFAVPAAIFFARQWLENFAYRIELGAGVFILTTLLAITIALLAVSVQAFRAATTNPVKALR